MEPSEAYFKLWAGSKFAPCLECLKMKQKMKMVMTKEGFICAKCQLEKELDSEVFIQAENR